jgi:hypothetical protein
MDDLMRYILAAGLSLSLTLVAMAEESSPGRRAAKSPPSRDDLIQTALSAAPAQIAREAGVLLPDPDGKLVEAWKSTNGFHCIPSVNRRPDPDPMCFDAAAGQWVQSLESKAEKPANTVPGISYMAQGGYHWEKDGVPVMDEQPGARLVREPPHWMLMWPFSAAATKLPTRPNPSGAWIMFDATPYAHLMIYQDPAKMKD